MILGLGKTIDKFSDGLLYAAICILVVFAVLVIIYLVISLLNKIKGLDDKEVIANKVEDSNQIASNVLEDEDMVVAALVASIDYQNETNGDVRLVSIKKL